jgi:hypothetical protein
MEMSKKYFNDLGMLAIIYQTCLDQGFSDEDIDQEISDIAEYLESSEEYVKELLSLIRKKISDGIKLDDEFKASLQAEERVEVLIKERGGLDGVTTDEIVQIFEEELDKFDIQIEFPVDMYDTIRSMFTPE